MPEKIKSLDAAAWSDYEKSWEMFQRPDQRMSIEEFARRQTDKRFKAFVTMKFYLRRCVELRDWLERNKGWVDNEAREQAGRELLFHEHAAKYYEKIARGAAPVEFLKDWEAGLPPDLRKKLHDVKYLPTRAEALQIPALARQFPWRNDFFDHEVWNREYIEALAEHLLDSIKSKIERGEPAVILDAGAGSGRLTYFLNQLVLEKLGPEKARLVRIIGVDKKLDHVLPGMEVEKIDIKAAGEKYKPDVVVSSWPVGEIQDAVARMADLQKFIFIGEPELVPFYDADGANNVAEFDGFKSRELPELKKWQTGVEPGCTTVEWVREAETR